MTKDNDYIAPDGFDKSKSGYDTYWWYERSNPTIIAYSRMGYTNQPSEFWILDDMREIYRCEVVNGDPRSVSVRRLLHQHGFGQQADPALKVYTAEEVYHITETAHKNEEAWAKIVWQLANLVDDVATDDDHWKKAWEIAKQAGVEPDDYQTGRWGFDD